MDQPGRLPSILYVPTMRAYFRFDSAAGGYVVDPEVLPDEEFLVQLSRAGLLGEGSLETGEDAIIYALLPLRGAASAPVRGLAEGPRHAATGGCSGLRFRRATTP